jgi:hypothetical protein
VNETQLPELLLQDPLTNTTRRVRAGLLWACVLGVIIEKTGLLPSKVDNFGIEFTADHKIFILVIILGAVLYFAIEFFVYALSDFTRWQLNRRSLLLPRKAKDNRALIFEGFDENEKPKIADNQDMGLREAAARARLEKLLDEAMRKYMRPYYQMAAPLGWVRVSLEFAFPILFAGYTAFLLLRLIRHYLTSA